MLREAFRVEPIYRVLIDAGDRIDGVAPMYYSSSLIAGKHIATLDGGILARTPEAGQILLHDATEQARQRGARYLLMRGGVGPYQRRGYDHACVPLPAFDRRNRRDSWQLGQEDAQSDPPRGEARLDRRSPALDSRTSSITCSPARRKA